MTNPRPFPVTVGEPNWVPLELAVPARELDNFMYMGRVGDIELYKHWTTRRYLNIERTSQRFYRYVDGKYVEIPKAAALEHVLSQNISTGE
jgi:hypothetical protein